MLCKLISIVALAATSAAAFATPTISVRDDARALNPPITSLVDSSAVPTPQLAARRSTNAERLTAGLSPNPPRRRAHNPARSVPSGSPSSSATEGYLQIWLTGVDRGTTQPLGYIRNVYNPYGEYGTLTDDQSEALVVSIDLDDAATGTAGIKTVNGPNADFPFFGGIVGFSSTSSDLNAGSSNYVYLGGTTETTPNSPPTDGKNSFSTATALPEQIESAIFTYDNDSKMILAQWINNDSSSPDTYIGYVESDKALVLTGSKSAFSSQFGGKWVDIVFVRKA